MNAVPAYSTKDELLLNNLMNFYKNEAYLSKMLKIITGESKISLRIVDWFATNYAITHYIQLLTYMEIIFASKFISIIN